MDRTEYQSDDQLRHSKKLSVEPTRPPAKIEGYSIQDFVGRGSYGEVWTAIDQKTGKRVAIKFYAQRSNSDVKQLAQEVEKLVVLAADRYVVQLLDVGWDATPPYFVMDYIDHGSLEDQINSGEPVLVERAVEVFRDVATGLMHLHGKGILHCDLKPGNVLLDQDGNSRLADFGQSRLQTDNTSALGTLFFMAPEQADLNSTPDAKWDVYGLGAVLYSMLTGRPPYFSEELKEKIQAAEKLSDRLKLYRKTLMSAKTPKAHRKVAGVDRSLADIIDRCIAANPKDRFPSAESVIDALRVRSLRQERKPLMLLGILGPLLLLTFMSGFGWYAFRQATGEAEDAIVDTSRQSNDFAAKLAARSAAEQLNDYFRSVRRLSRDEKFVHTLKEVLENDWLEEVRSSLSDPNKNSDPQIAQARERFRSHPTRQKLQPFLERRLSNVDGEFPQAASWFVTDRYGNQLAGVFDSGKSDTIGKNYSFRTYFTGQDKDVMGGEGEPRYAVTQDREERMMIQMQHLSASFRSQASGLWKIAFSTPVVDPETKAPLGIVAVTVNLGSLVDFDNTNDQYVMLVDDRPGDNRGVILEHPLFHEIGDGESSNRLPDALTQTKVDLAGIKETATSKDPIGESEQGEKYDSEYIAAVVPVALSSRSTASEGAAGKVEDDKQSGLVVLAFEDYGSVVDPSRKLSRGLLRMAVLALLLLLSVAVGMWFLVSRLFRDTNRRLFGAIGTATLSASSITSAPESTNKNESNSESRKQFLTERDSNSLTMEKNSDR